MTITIRSLHPLLCAEISGVDAGTPMDEATFAEIRAKQPQFRYSHAWRQGNLVIWDNRAVLHRATAYDTVRHQRLIQRTTAQGDGPTVAQPERYKLAAK